MKTTASFRLIGSSGLTAKAVTDGLSLAPSRSYEAGDAVTPGSSKVRKSSIWVLKSSERIEDGVELATQLDRLPMVPKCLTTGESGAVMIRTVALRPFDDSARSFYELEVDWPKP